jgi:hypothetical protein
MRSACAKILLREASLPGGRQLALNSRKATILFIRRRRKPDIGRIGIAKTVAQFAAPTQRPYSELRLVLPSKTPARTDNVSGTSMLR